MEMSPIEQAPPLFDGGVLRSTELDARCDFRLRQIFGQAFVSQILK
jgi:hypothetical protein